MQSTARSPHESCYRELDHLAWVHEFGCLCRAKPLQSIIRPFPDHPPDALTELVEICTDAAACSLAALVCQRTLQNPERANRFSGVRSTLGCCGAKPGLLAGATSGTPSAVLFGQTLWGPHCGTAVGVMLLPA